MLSSCNFFEWYDDDISPRAKTVINRLKDEMDAMEAEVGRIRGKHRMYWRIILIFWLVVGVLLLKNL